MSSTVNAGLQIRQATLADIPQLADLIERSVRELQANDYSATQIEGALGTVFGIDTQLIADGTYYACTDGANIAGCGGWSKRKTLFGADREASREDSLLDPRHDRARIRAFFVDPQWARRGVGSMILAACEAAAGGAGFQAFELGATLTGEPLYRARGYEVLERIEVPLPNGATLPVIRMKKNA